MQQRSNILSRAARCPSRLAVLVPCAALVLSCSAGSPGGEESSSSVRPHPVQASALKDVMRSFDEAVRRRVPAETDVHDRWEGVFPKIATAASELQLAATQLSGHPPKGLEIPARGRFQVLGKALEDAAAALRRAAESADADAVSAARTGVGRACRDCHERFRPDSPGVPDAFR